MATITNVKLSFGGSLTATAPSGEIAPPPAHHLTITGATWQPQVKDPMAYLEQQCSLEALAIGKEYTGTFKVFSIGQDRTTIKLDPV
jgi:hypothetical protein